MEKVQYNQYSQYESYEAKTEAGSPATAYQHPTSEDPITPVSTQQPYTSANAPAWSKPELPVPNSTRPRLPKDAVPRFDQLSENAEIDIFALMETIHKLTQTQRKTAREIRYSEYQQKWQALDGAAKELRSAATKEMVAGLVQGAIQMAGGAYSVHVTVKSTVQTQRLMKDLEASSVDLNSPKFQFMQNQFQAKLNVQQNLGNLGQTFTQLGQGAGSVIAAPLNYGAKLDEEDQKQYEAESEKKSAHIDEVKDFLSELKEIMDAVRSKLAAIEQSRFETRQKILS
ncbi:MAG: hypothetical protein P8X74_14905 [Reinekea sp.]|jgi:hypothetical protein